jgi:hypothetical protein
VTGERHYATEDVRYVQAIISAEFAEKRAELVERGGNYYPQSEVAQYYEGYYDGIAEADRIVAEIINRYARDGRIVR